MGELLCISKFSEDPLLNLVDQTSHAVTDVVATAALVSEAVVLPECGESILGVAFPTLSHTIGVARFMAGRDSERGQHNCEDFHFFN